MSIPVSPNGYSVAAWQRGKRGSVHRCHRRTGPVAVTITDDDGGNQGTATSTVSPSGVSNRAGDGDAVVGTGEQRDDPTDACGRHAGGGRPRVRWRASRSRPPVRAPRARSRRPTTTTRSRCRWTPTILPDGGGHSDLGHTDAITDDDGEKLETECGLDGVAFRRAEPGGGGPTGEGDGDPVVGAVDHVTTPLMLTADMAEEDDFGALAGTTVNADSTTASGTVRRTKTPTPATRGSRCRWTAASRCRWRRALRRRCESPITDDDGGTDRIPATRHHPTRA